MTAWRYARLLATRVNAREVRSGVIRRRRFIVFDWNAEWLDPDDVRSEQGWPDAEFPIRLLARFGAEGWEVAAAFRDPDPFEGGAQYEFVMKQPIGPVS
jgi:hypothetical protein